MADRICGDQKAKQSLQRGGLRRRPIGDAEGGRSLRPRQLGTTCGVGVGIML